MKWWNWIVDFLNSTDTTTGQQIIADVIVAALVVVLGWLIVRFRKVISALFKKFFNYCAKNIEKYKSHNRIKKIQKLENELSKLDEMICKDEEGEKK